MLTPHPTPLKKFERFQHLSTPEVGGFNSLNTYQHITTPPHPPPSLNFGRQHLCAQCLAHDIDFLRTVITRHYSMTRCKWQKKTCFNCDHSLFVTYLVINLKVISPSHITNLFKKRWQSLWMLFCYSSPRKITHFLNYIPSLSTPSLASVNAITSPKNPTGIRLP